MIKHNSYDKYAYLWLLSSMLLFFIGVNALSPLWAAYVLKLGGTLKTAGFAIGIGSASFGVFNLVWGWLQDIYQNDKLYISLSFLITALLFLLYPYVQSPMELYILQFLIGVVSAMQGPAITDLYSKQIRDNQETFAWGVFAASIQVSNAIGAIIGSHVAHYFGYNAVFYVMSIFAGIASLFTPYVFKKLM